MSISRLTTRGVTRAHRTVLGASRRTLTVLIGSIMLWSLPNRVEPRRRSCTARSDRSGCTVWRATPTDNPSTCTANTA